MDPNAEPSSTGATASENTPTTDAPTDGPRDAPPTMSKVQAKIAAIEAKVEGTNGAGTGSEQAEAFTVAAPSQQPQHSQTHSQVTEQPVPTTEQPPQSSEPLVQESSTPSAPPAAVPAEEAQQAPAAEESKPPPATESVASNDEQMESPEALPTASDGMTTNTVAGSAAGPQPGDSAGVPATRVPGGASVFSQPRDDQDLPMEVREDADSAIDDDYEGSTTSLTSSIYQYRKLHGRPFHREFGNASYWGMVDDNHAEALDILHHVYSLILDGAIYAAPLEDPKMILDVGTGTGIWAIDMADMFPDAEVVGTDISPTQPTWIPPNLKFELEDCTQDWSFDSNTYDYIHMRYLNGSIVDWLALFREAYRTLRPGGYIESCEASARTSCDDDTLDPNSATHRWSEIFLEFGRKTGRSFILSEDHGFKKVMEEAGFVDVKEHPFKMPTSGWPKDPHLREIGDYVNLSVEADGAGYVLFLTNVLGWSREEVELFVAQVRKEGRQRRIHAYFFGAMVVGRKPFPEEITA